MVKGVLVTTDGKTWTENTAILDQVYNTDEVLNAGNGDTDGIIKKGDTFYTWDNGIVMWTKDF